MNPLKHWRQTWRIAEMRLLFFALLVSVTAVTSVNFFTDRTDRAMTQQAIKLVGADLTLRSSRPLDKQILEDAAELGLTSAEMVSFASMVSLGETLKLSQVRAVSENYPLRGAVRTATEPGDTVGTAESLTELNTGQVWAEGRLFSELGAKAGNEVRIGRSLFKLNKIITAAPNQGGGMFQFSPEVLMPLADLKATGLLTPGSRARFSYLFAGDPATINDFAAKLKPTLKAGERLETLTDGLPSINTALQRAQRFLNTAALLSVILAGAAIALTSYSFSRHETHSVAVLKTIGASRRRILLRYLGQLLMTATAAAILGALLGYVIQTVAAYLLRDFIGQTLPQPGLLPLVIGFITAWVMMFSFSLPQLMQLVNTEPVQIFQNQPQPQSLSLRLLIASILGGIFVLMWMQTRDLKLSVFIFIGTLIAVLLFWIVSTLLLKFLRVISSRSSNSLRAVINSGQRLPILISVFGIGLFSLLLLTALRTDLLDRWQNSMPADAPNHFLVNIQPDEETGITDYLKGRSTDPDLFPIIRGRLVELKGKPVVPEDYPQDARRLLRREFNLSSVATLPQANIMLEGEWFAPDSATGYSVEESVAERFGLSIGDSMTFDIAGQRFTQKITSTRRVNWDNLTPNFFVLAAPGLMESMPRTYITSLYVPPSDRSFIADLVKRFPSVSAIDVSALMEQIRDLINKAAFAVQAIFIFTLIAGIIVLFAALQSQKAERRRELAILKTLGAKRDLLRRNLLVEFAFIGGLAGLMAGLFAVIASNTAAYMLFDLEPSVNWLLVLIGTVSGALLVSIAGYLNVRPLLNVGPVMLFQEHAN